MPAPPTAQSNQFFNGSADMLCVATFDGLLEQINPAWTAILGFSNDELKARPFFDFAHPDDRSAAVDYFERLKTQEFPLYIENRYLCKDGSYRWLAWTSGPIMTNGLLYLFARDITERKQREDEIRALNRALEARAAELERINGELQVQIRVREQAEAALKDRNAELEGFCYSVSHDLRAPLRAMQGFAGALLEDCNEELSVAGRDYAARIVAAANRMDTLVQDLLLYSRISYNELPLQSVDLRLAVTEAMRQLEAPLREGRASIVIHPPLPSVIGHYATVVQVISNLLSNGVKFVEEGIQACVQLRVETFGDKARLWVQDNGIGISPEYHTRIFRMFERLHGMDAYPGTGIGLAIVRKAVERMGGRVGVESQEGQGSSFWVELPLDCSAKPVECPPTDSFFEPRAEPACD